MERSQPATRGLAGETGEPGLGVSQRRQPAKGMFLIASHQLLDPNFARTVVLLTAVDERGASGLIINRPTAVAVDAALPQLTERNEGIGFVHLGGPVAINTLRVLVRSDAAVDGAQQIIDGVHLTESLAVVRHLIESDDENLRLHYYAGYAGWAPGQLQAEIRRGDWHLWKADQSSVFDRDPGAVWDELMQFVWGQWTQVAPAEYLDLRSVAIPQM